MLLALGAFVLAFGARHGVEAHLALRARRPVPAHAQCRAEEPTLRAVATHWWQEALLGVGMLTLAMLMHRGSVGMLLLIAAGFFAGRASGNALEAHLLARWERASGTGLSTSATSTPPRPRSRQPRLRTRRWPADAGRGPASSG